MKNTLLFLIPVLYLIACNNTANKTVNKLINTEVQDTVWKEFTTKDSIPPILKEKLNQYFKGLPVADFGQKFNATDMMVNSLPGMQIQYLARKGNEWRMTYLQGGFAKYYILIEAILNKNSVIIFRAARSNFVLKEGDLIDAAIKSGNLQFDTLAQ